MIIESKHGCFYPDEHSKTKCDVCEFEKPVFEPRACDIADKIKQQNQDFHSCPYYGTDILILTCPRCKSEHVLEEEDIVAMHAILDEYIKTPKRYCDKCLKKIRGKVEGLDFVHIKKEFFAYDVCMSCFEKNREEFMS